MAPVSFLHRSSPSAISVRRLDDQNSLDRARRGIFALVCPDHRWFAEPEYRSVHLVLRNLSVVHYRYEAALSDLDEPPTPIGRHPRKLTHYRIFTSARPRGLAATSDYHNCTRKRDQSHQVCRWYSFLADRRFVVACMLERTRGDAATSERNLLQDGNGVRNRIDRQVWG